MDTKIEQAASWLLKRKNCTLDMAFSEMLDLAEVYVKAAEGMGTDRGNKPTFVIEKGGSIKRRFFVRGWPLGTNQTGDYMTVEFVLEAENNRIGIGYPDPPGGRELPNLYVTQRWNAREVTCALCLENEEWTVEQITQKALDPLFFS